MKPVIFDYVCHQDSDDFERISYSYDDDVNKLDGKNIPKKNCANILPITKTFTGRESDEDPIMMHLTKTKILRESDDQ